MKIHKRYVVQLTYRMVAVFSSYSMGKEGYYLYIGNSDTDIDRTDYSTLNGKRIGINEGSIQTELFDEWARENEVCAEVRVFCKQSGPYNSHQPLRWTYVYYTVRQCFSIICCAAG